MVSNVGGNKSTFGDLTAKLQERQKALESLNAQKQAVMQELDNANSDIQVREGITAEDKNKLADYVVAYQNLKEPDVVNEPGKEPVQADYTKSEVGEDGSSKIVEDKGAYNTAHKEWEEAKAKYDQYQQDLEKYNNQKAALENKINEYKAIDAENQDFLTKLNDIADAKEKELIQNQNGIDVNTGDIERLNQEIANMKDISFGVEDGDSKGYSAAVQRQFAALQEAGLIPADADQKDFTPQEMANLANKLVELDKANGTVGANENGMSKYYKTMQAGESYGNYSLDQINELLEASGAGSINLNESFGISMAELDKLGSEPVVKAEPPVEATVTDHPPVYYKGDDSGDESEVLLSPQMQTSVTDHPPVYFNDGASGSEPVVKAEPPVEATVTDHPPVQYEGEGSSEVSPNPTTPASAPQVKTPSGKLTREQIDQKIKDLKPGETYTYNNSVSVSGTGFASASFKSITWTRNEDGTLTCSYTNPGLSPSRVQENYTADRQILSTISTNKRNPFENVTTNYGADGKVSERTIDLSSLYSDQSNSFATKQQRVMNYLRSHQNDYASQNITGSKGEVILTYKQGKYYRPNGNEVSDSKAYSIIEKAINKKNISTINQAV